MRPRCLAIVFVSTALAHASAQMPRYPGAIPISIGDELAVSGERFRISYFTTADSVSTAANYFLEIWGRMGLPTTVDGRPEEEMIVSAFYTREGLQQAVVLRRRSDKTIGFAAVRDLWFSAGPEPADFFSPPEGAVLHGVESRDVAARMRHRTTLVDAKLETAIARIKDDLSKKGYALARELAIAREGGRQLRLEHVRGERRLLTQVAEVEDGTTAVVQTCLGCAEAPDSENHDLTWGSR